MASPLFKELSQLKASLQLIANLLNKSLADVPDNRVVVKAGDILVTAGEIRHAADILTNRGSLGKPHWKKIDRPSKLVVIKR